MKYPPEPLTPSEASALIDAADVRRVSGMRDRALLTLLYRSGLRCSEGLALRTWDVDTDGGTVRVMRGKGDKNRTVGMDARAFKVIDEWRGQRTAAGIESDWLFCSLAGGRIDSSYVRRMIKKLAKRAGIERRVHAHGLRHTLACELRAEGVDIGIISRQLGHSSIATTSRYLDHISPAAVIKVMGERIWE